MSVHMLDMAGFEDALSTAAMRKVFEESALFQRWLDVEAALATAQASLGMIPAASGAAIAAAAKVERIDFQAVKAHGRETGHSLVPLLRELRRVGAQAWPTSLLAFSSWPPCSSPPWSECWEKAGWSPAPLTTSILPPLRP